MTVEELKDCKQRLLWHWNIDCQREGLVALIDAEIERQSVTSGDGLNYKKMYETSEEANLYLLGKLEAVADCLREYAYGGDFDLHKELCKIVQPVEDK